MGVLGRKKAIGLKKGLFKRSLGAVNMEDLAKKKAIRVKTYFSKTDFAAVAKEAQEAGFRRAGLKLFTTTDNFKVREKLVANTDGISKYLKFCRTQYITNLPKLLEAQAEILKEEERIKERKRELGMA